MELLPCPFCGGTSVTVEEGTTYRWAVETCVDCGATYSEVRAVPDVVKTQELALAEWNRRASPASVPAVTDGMALAFHRALTDGSIGQPEVDEIKTGLRAALAAAPTPPVSEDRKDAQIERLEHLTTAIDDRCGKTIEKQSAALKLAREALFDMQDSYAAVHGWKDSFVIAATTAIAAIDSLQKGE